MPFPDKYALFLQVIFPADRNGVVAIKPTVGLTSRRGIIPESSSLDTVGPFGRTVADVAIVLDSIVDTCENGSKCPPCLSSNAKFRV